MDSAAERRARASRRAKVMILRKGKLGDEVDLSPIRGAAAIALAAQLSREAFSLAGVDAPSIPRGELPLRFVPRSS